MRTQRRLGNDSHSWVRYGLVLLAVLALGLAACAEAPQDDDTDEPPAEDVDTEAADVVIGYISGGEASPFVSQASQNIRDEARAAGVELVECDTEFLADKAVECGRTIAAGNPDAVINWQFHPDASAAVCDAYGNLPTVTMDTPNEPCAEVFVGANNHEAGLIAGAALGDFAQDELGCEYDIFLQVELPSLVDVNRDRAGGTREGFENVCGEIADDRYVMVDKEQGGDDHLENIRRITTDVLSANPDARTILVSAPFSDADAVALLGAVDTAGRDADIAGLVAQGAEEIGHDYIRDDPRWLGSVAYFPERYGSLAVPAAISLARGEAVDEEILIEHELITAENIDEHYPGD